MEIKRSGNKAMFPTATPEAPESSLRGGAQGGQGDPTADHEQDIENPTPKSSKAPEIFQNKTK